MLMSKQTSINVNQEVLDYKYAHHKTTKTGLKSKLKMKWATIKWFMDNKKDMLNKFLSLKDILCNIIKQKVANIINLFLLIYINILY